MSFPGSLQYKNKMDAQRKKIQYVAASSRAVVVTKSLPASFAPPGPLLMSSMVTSTSSATQISTQMPSGVHAVTLAEHVFSVPPLTSEVTALFGDSRQRRRLKPIFFAPPMKLPSTKASGKQPVDGSCGRRYCCFALVDADPPLSTVAPPPPITSLKFDYYEAFGGIGSGAEAFGQLNCEGLHHGNEFRPTHSYRSRGGFDFDKRKTLLSGLQHAAVGLARPIPLFSGGFNARPETLERKRVKKVDVDTSDQSRVKKKRKKNEESVESMSNVLSDGDGEEGVDEGSVDYVVETILCHCISEDGAFHFLIKCRDYDADWSIATTSILRNLHDRALLKVYLKPYGVTLAEVQKAQSYAKKFVLKKKVVMSRAGTVKKIAEVKAGHHGIFLITASCKNVSLIPSRWCYSILINTYTQLASLVITQLIHPSPSVPSPPPLPRLRHSTHL